MSRAVCLGQCVKARACHGQSDATAVCHGQCASPSVYVCASEGMHQSIMSCMHALCQAHVRYEHRNHYAFVCVQVRGGRDESMMHACVGAHGCMHVWARMCTFTSIVPRTLLLSGFLKYCTFSSDMTNLSERREKQNGEKYLLL